VQGESLKNEAIESTDAGSFYDKIGEAENTLHTFNEYSQYKMLFTILILVMLAGTTYLVFRNKT
jgi:hypothetical protein